MIVNANSIVQHAIQIKNGIMINVYASVKKYCSCKKDYSWNPSPYICESIRYSKSIVDNSVIACNEITNATDSVKSTVLINSDDKKVRYKMDYYIWHTFLLVTILIFIYYHCYHYAKHETKQKILTH